jgi:hypothetical protein
MWDPERDPAAIRVEFCQGYYGPAAGDVLEYLALMDGAAADPEVHAFCSWDPQGTVTPAFVSDGLEMLARAGASADSPGIANRVDRLRLPLWYMRLTYPDRYGLSPADGARLLEEFKRVIAANRIDHIGEGFSGPNMPRWLAQMKARRGGGPA